MKEEVNNILEKLDSTNEIKRLKELNNILNNNEEYISLMNEFNDKKDDYILNNTYDKEVLNIRQKLFSIPELKEYLSIQNELRLLFTKINNIIFDIVK